MAAKVKGTDASGAARGGDTAGLKNPPADLRRVLRELMDLNMALAEFGDKIATRLKVTRRDLVALTALEQDGELTAGRIGELLGLTSGAATGVINRLERAGHATREVNPKDGRSVMVRPTAAGRRRLDEIWGEAARAFDSGMPAPQDARAAELMACLITATRALREGQDLLD